MGLNKTFLILGLAVALLIGGCTTSAEGSQEYDYLPAGGQGCGFSAEYEEDSTPEIPLEEETTKEFYF